MPRSLALFPSSTLATSIERATAAWAPDVPLLVGAAAAGLIAGWGCAAALRPARYRLPEECALPVQEARWAPWALAITFATVVGALGGRYGAAPTAVYLAAATWLACLSIVDLDVHRLPDAFTLPAYVAVPGALAACTLTGAGLESAGLIRAVGGGLTLGAAYLVCYAAGRSRGGLGLGDVKLAVPLGMLLGWLGWATLVAGAYAGFVISGLVGVLGLMHRRGGRHTPHAHGPAMALGALVGVLVT